MTRREFIVGAAALAAGRDLSALPGRRLAKNLTLLVGDAHINGTKGGSHHMIDAFKGIVADVLKLDPLPARIVFLGDYSYSTSPLSDLRKFAQLLAPLTDAGMSFSCTMGNHDSRSAFAEVFPEQAAQTKVPGWFVSVVDAGDVDFLLLDTLWSKDGPGSAYGVLNYDKDNRAQFDYIADVLPKWPKPVFVCAHHPLNEIHWGGGAFLIREMCAAPNVVGFLHGHEHRWHPNWFNRDWSSNAIVRTLGLPSAGAWGDIGYVLLSTEHSKATARFVQSGFWFKTDVPVDERMKGLCRTIAGDVRGAVCTFPISHTP